MLLESNAIEIILIRKKPSLHENIVTKKIKKKKKNHIIAKQKHFIFYSES